jgi:hypothetical protein
MQLNMQMAKASLELSQARWLNALSGKGRWRSSRWPSGAQPFAERVAAYNRQLLEILTSERSRVAGATGRRSI